MSIGAPMGWSRAGGLAMALAMALLALSSEAAPSKPSSAPAPLDTARIRSLYVEGEFEDASRLLEVAFHSGQLRTHGDSVFAFKHLGVIYTAQAETRERGKYHLVQLLMIEPSAKILDMYASDMIYMIFRNLQDEVAAQFRTHIPRDTAAANPGNARDQAPAKSSSSLKTVAWIGTAALAVGAGVAAYLLLEKDSGEDFPVD